MPNNNYARGANFERRFVAWLKEHGAVAGRIAGSHGSFDVFAAHKGLIILCQLKTGSARAAKEEIAALRADADVAGARPFVITKKRGSKDDFFDLFFVSPELKLVPASPTTLEEPF